MPRPRLAMRKVRDILPLAVGQGLSHRQVALATTLALTSGMREGEILALRWRDVDLEVGDVHVRAGKTARSRRTVPLTQVARDALGAPGAPEALVFPSAAGTPIDRRNLLRAWHEFSLEVLGRRTPFHGLRHSAATLMLGQGLPLRTVSDMLGHSSIASPSRATSMWRRRRPEVRGGPAGGVPLAV